MLLRARATAFYTLRSALLTLLLAAPCLAQTNATLRELNQRAFFLGREYFVLRSGRAQMVVQADRADLGPAFTFLLFDAEDASQSAHKDRAFNFVPGEGFLSSALAVELGGFPFTALGHRTDTRWVMADGIPAVEAVWWAGGVRVTEHISAVSTNGVFRRRIQLEGANLVGDEQVRLSLGLPPGACRREGEVLLQEVKGAALALALPHVGHAIVPGTNQLYIGPMAVGPRARVEIDTFLLVQIPGGGTDGLMRDAQALAQSRADAGLAATRQRWSAVSSVSTKDRTVQEIFDKARFGLPGMIAADGTMDAGIFEYGAQWVRDTSNTTLGALHAGHFELARAALLRMLTKMISKDGATMIAGSFEEPDREQFDQMGELLHCLRSYRDWTGDDSLVRQHRELLLAMIERPLHPQFRDDTGMVHNRREFWERVFDNAYELAAADSSDFGEGP